MDNRHFQPTQPSSLIFMMSVMHHVIQRCPIMNKCEVRISKQNSVKN